MGAQKGNIKNKKAIAGPRHHGGRPAVVARKPRGAVGKFSKMSYNDATITSNPMQSTHSDEGSGESRHGPEGEGNHRAGANAQAGASGHDQRAIARGGDRDEGSESKHGPLPRIPRQ